MTEGNHWEKTAAASPYEGLMEEKVRIAVTIRISNGFWIQRSNIDYRTLIGQVEKMEALC